MYEWVAKLTDVVDVVDVGRYIVFIFWYCYFGVLMAWSMEIEIRKPWTLLYYDIFDDPYTCFANKIFHESNLKLEMEFLID